MQGMHVKSVNSDNSIDSTWRELTTELDAWAENDLLATFWWRDDDAIAPGPKLDRLLDLTSDSGLLLAVIPAHAQDELATVIERSAHVTVGQHGYAHTNHAQPSHEQGRVGQGAWELGLHRAENEILAELAIGKTRLGTLFGSRFIPALIPPWNNIDPALFTPVAENGYCGVSLFGPRNAVVVPEHFVVSNAHCDPVNWKNGPQFTGEAKAIAQVVNHLSARRTGNVDKDEATGVLTHHAVLDEESWHFCSRLEKTISDHPAAHWCSARELFRVSP